MLAELSRILARGKVDEAIAATGLPREEMVLGYAELTTVVVPARIAPTVMADPADDQVLACALAARVDWIVSGDKHLRGLGGQYHGIGIIRPAEAVPMIVAS